MSRLVYNQKKKTLKNLKISKIKMIKKYIKNQINMILKKDMYITTYILIHIIIYIYIYLQSVPLMLQSESPSKTATKGTNTEN